MRYMCESCKRTGVKLWRLYQSTPVRLLCCECAAANQGEDISTLNTFGMHIDDLGNVTDKIGSMVAAVPDGDGNFWGYTSVPEHLVEWWKHLPNLKD